MFLGIQSGIQRVALAQAVLALLAAMVGGVFAGINAALAALFGGLVALAVSAVLVWHERQSKRHPEWDQHRLFKMFIRAGVERLFVLAGLLAVGLAGLKLSPLPLLLGLLLAQFGWLAAALGRKH
jgi:ATP synthase protein I